VSLIGPFSCLLVGVDGKINTLLFFDPFEGAGGSLNLSSSYKLL